MTNLRDPKFVKRGLRALRAADPVMAGMIARVGKFGLKPQRARYALLVRSIISQQISVAAARTVRGRLMDLLPGRQVVPESVSALTDEELRAVGLSGQKASYIRNLTQHVVDGSVNFRRIGQLSDAGVIEELIKVKGIGVWTAQMFLMFALGRPNVFAPDDLALRAAIRNEYGFDEMPSRKEAVEIAEQWAPYQSIASWYCWRSLDSGD